MPVSINCRSCRGAKKYWGVGMMRQYDCETCNGTGFEEIVDENKQEAIAEISTEAKEVKKKVVKKAATSKSVLKKKVTKKAAE